MLRPTLRTPVTFINAQLADGRIAGVRIVGSRIAALGADPQPGDAVVDLDGDRVLPGLINAHDHLQLNSLPRCQDGRRYDHARDWISDVNARRHADPAFAARIAITRHERLLWGGVKNLLSGVTTVAHHDPLYSDLLSDDYPTQVVLAYGWSHSLYVDGDRRVTESHRNTRRDRPWIIHAAEGIGEEARREFDRLDALGCLGPNTLLVHGIALDRVQRRRLHQAHAGLIWCPTSNLGLFGRTADVSELLDHGRVALGTDSRLSGSRDLLDELRVAGEAGGLDERTLEALVTRDAARLLRLKDRGELRAGARADILILPASARLSATKRADVRLVLINGVARYGDRKLALDASPSATWAQIRIDGKPKVLDQRIASQIAGTSVEETGLELPSSAWRAA